MRAHVREAVRGLQARVIDMSTNDCGPINGLVWLANREPEPEHPKVYWHEGCLWLDLADGRDYKVPADPMKVLGFIQHFSEKTWATRDWIDDAIERRPKHTPSYGVQLKTLHLTQ